MKPYERTPANGKAATRLAVGDVVAYRGSSAVASKACPTGRENHSKATIAVLMADCPGGVYLDRDLHGSRYWNAEDLRVVGRTKS